MEGRGLSLSRRPGESILLELPDGRTITICYVRPGKLSVKAPQDVKIWRAETRA